MKVNEPPIIVSHIFPKLKEQVWKAITEKEEMIHWFFDNIPGFNPEVGFSTEFKVHVEDKTFTHLWEITEVIPYQKLVLNWKYEEYPGDSFVTFELSETNNSTCLTLTANVIEDFPDEIPEFKRESCVGGWTYFIKDSLAKYLNN